MRTLNAREPLYAPAASGEFGSDVNGARTAAGWRYSNGLPNVTPFVSLDMISIRTAGPVEDRVGIPGLTFDPLDRGSALVRAYP